MTNPATTTRTAACGCGQLRIEVDGEPLGVGVCHCFACQQRTGSVFATLESFAAPYRVTGNATEYRRIGDQGASFVFRFCPVCGSNLFHTEDGVCNRVSIAVGGFRDSMFPAPTVSVHDRRRHDWVRLPKAMIRFDGDPP